MRRERSPEPDVYRIRGSVEEQETGRPLPDLIVRAFDKDLFFDDKLGFATTDPDGCFEIRFRSEDFRDLRESHPDVYLRVFDASGTRLLHETRDRVRWNASPDEHFRIAVAARALVPPGAR